MIHDHMWTEVIEAEVIEAEVIEAEVIEASMSCWGQVQAVARPLKMIQARQEARKRRKLRFAIRNWDSKDSPYQYRVFPHKFRIFSTFLHVFFKNWRDNAGRDISLNGASS